MKKIGIIGSGAAGLCALRHSLATEEFIPVVWEHSHKVGGTWAFNPKVGKDEHGYPIHSSMYSSLRTNLPKEVMAFPDFPFKRGGKSFVHHTEVLQYLNEYADHYDLKPWIKLQHHVSNVEKIDNADEQNVWKVTVKDLVSGTNESYICDALIVCNGHYSVPKLPKISGMKQFTGSISHSHDYRNNESFQNKDVIVLGAAASGMDIALEVAKVANKVYLSHNLPVPIPSVLPSNLEQVKGIGEAKSDGFILLDGTEVQANALIMCTGYEFDFPFLGESCGIRVEDNQVKTLYKHIINTAQPTMGFVGIAFQILPFPVFDMQVQYFLHVLLKKIDIPNKREMEDQIKRETTLKEFEGIKRTHFHYFGDKQWPYMNELGMEVGTKTVQIEGWRNLYNLVWERRKFSLATYKELDYDLTFDSNGKYHLEESRNGTKLNTRMEIAVLMSVQICKLLLFNFKDTMKFFYKRIVTKLRMYYRFRNG